MPSDSKQCGKRKKKRRFQGNQHKKLKSVPDEVENERDVTDQTGNEESVHWRLLMTVNLAHLGSKHCQVPRPLGMSVGAFTERFLQDKDTLRILTSQRRAHTTTKEYRRRKRLQRLGKEEELAEIEGFPYLAGGH
ncbi:uncharacterized protein LOC143283461 [Babylonia areolata]|uniref:uncharacterized protein LOC143283461 n=1 Tax=Babylonia areolata TaxID=304850 RepID=UPI003FD1441E